MGRKIVFAACAAWAVLASPAARAQIKPITSGDLSYNEPELRRHGSGFHHPRRAHYVHRHHVRRFR